MQWLGLTVLCLGGASAPVLWALWTHRGRPWMWRVAMVPTAGIAIAILASGEPLLLVPVGLVVGVAILARRAFAPAGRATVAVLVVCAGFPLYALTFFAAAIGIAAFGCAPDAYECPL